MNEANQIQVIDVPMQNRSLNILRLLWERFLRQAWRYKLITIFVIVFVVAWMIMFYSTFLIWKVISWVTTKPLLSLTEWYLLKTQP